MSTKLKIIKQGITSFNKSSFGTVTLFEIAQSLGISRGNLTYHFKDKNVLLKAILEDMLEKMEVQRKKSRTLPSFENLHNEVQLYFKFQKTYSFIFRDSQVLKLPFVNKKFKEMTEQTILDNKAAIAFSIQLGNMKPEPFPGIYNNLAVMTWVLSFYWSAQNIVRNTSKNEDGEKVIWSLLLPHFTPKGVKAFKNYFGENYFNQMGEAFQFDINKYISF
ncbi:MAG: TetR/AcrR family transcriptional regulator [Saprospiraceae bacterium]